jgi:uncharacterized protein
MKKASLQFWPGLLLVLALLVPAWATLTFPELTGRVVDAANIIPPGKKNALEDKLAGYDAKTSDQIVVATVPSLQGTSIEDYANQLFRAWKLGQAKTNNGVLLLVAPNERKVRIEVGYGLEGQLTDALSNVIITTAMAPRFKAGDFAGGIDQAVDAIESVLTGDEEWQRRAKLRPEPQGSDAGYAVLILNILIFAFILYLAFRQRQSGGNRPYRTSRGNWIVIPSGGGNWGGGGWSGGGGGFSSGGGFSGGGGSSGGGGASGSW